MCLVLFSVVGLRSNIVICACVLYPGLWRLVFSIVCVMVPTQDGEIDEGEFVEIMKQTSLY